MYRPVSKTLDLPALERRILQFWSEIDAFQTLRAKNAGARPWSFLDGPITANNPMGVHHAWGRSYKDMYQRYWAMNGRDQRYQNGFDCQGLWVEVEVEKALGFQHKSDVYQYGIDRFVRACKERVLTYAARIVEQSIRLGYWSDWDDPAALLALREALARGDPEAERAIGRLGTPGAGGSYFTFSDENNYTIWSFLKKCHQEGFIYRGHDVMPWCPRCETGLSQMEIIEGRRITSHTSVFVRFPLRGQPGSALLVWTTTPWTLAANVAVAVNPGMRYLHVRHGDWTYYVGKGNFEQERVQDLSVEGAHEVHKLPSIRSILRGSGQVEVLGELSGDDLIGLSYNGPFDELPAQSEAAPAHRVIAWNQVSELEGTGLVHIAPGCGLEDQELGRDNHLATIAPLNDSGEYIEGFGELTGRQAVAVADLVIQQLRARKLLVAKESYPHVYPHCWRCKHELVFRPVEEWFIRMDWRDRIQRAVPTVRWIPPDGEAREQDWLRNMGDWMISKKRFWGLALPIWVCAGCGHFMVIGGKEELRAKAIEGWEEFDGHSPHRPFIDQVKIACERCGGKAERIPDVGNPWLDAGIVPFSTLGYNTDRAYWAKWFPADFVVESFPGQFRNWFYSLLAMSAMLEGTAPFRTLLGHAMVRDARGEEMHKSRGNAIAFDEAAEVLGADLMRYLYAQQNPAHNLNFPDLKSPGKDAEVRRKLLTFWNCYSFFVTYARVDEWAPVGQVPDLSSLDKWILSRLQRLIQTARRAFEEFEVHRLIEKFESFNEEFSNWYLRRSRRRFWKSEAAAYETLYTVLTTVTRVMAPVLPFLCEEIYQNLERSVNRDAAESVHLTTYPEVRSELIDEELERALETVIRIKNLALNLRTRAKVRIRQPLATLLVRPRDAQQRAVLSNPSYAAQVLEECNVKRLELIDDERAVARLVLKPNAKTLAPRYGRHLPEIAARLAAADPKQALAGGYRFALDGAEVSLSAQDVVAQYDAPPHLCVLEEEGAFLGLDTTISPELEREGIARDFNRSLQDYRKASGLEVDDRIVVRYAAPEHIRRALLEHAAYLQEELLADRLEAVDQLAGGATLKLAGAEVAVAIQLL